MIKYLSVSALANVCKPPPLAVTFVVMRTFSFASLNLLMMAALCSMDRSPLRSPTA